MNNTSLLNICIVGVGYIGTLHLKMYKMIQRKKRRKINITLIDKDLRKKKIAEQFGAKFYTDIDRAINENYFDIVDICLPTYLHHSVARKILQRTKSHLLIEKPLSLNYREALNLSKMVEKRRRIGMCAHVERFFEPLKQIKKWCQKHRPPYQLIFLRRIKKPKKSWLNKPRQGGSLILDVGIHDIDLLLWFMKSKIIQINSTMKDNLSLVNTKNVTIDLHFVNKSRATFYFSWDIAQNSKLSLINYIRISDKKGNAIIFDSLKNTITINNRPIKIKLPRYPNAYFAEIKHMIDCIIKKTNPKINFWEASKSIKVIDLIKKYS